MRAFSALFCLQTFTVLILAITILFSSTCLFSTTWAKMPFIHEKAPIPLVRPNPFITKKKFKKLLDKFTQNPKVFLRPTIILLLSNLKRVRRTFK